MQYLRINAKVIVEHTANKIFLGVYLWDQGGLLAKIKLDL